VKVPPKPPTYSKEKGLTRRTVKGAAGGMLGVHYEDTRHNDVNTVRSHTEKATSGAGTNRDGAQVILHGEAVAASAKSAADGAAQADLGGPKEEQEMVLDDEDATTRDAKKRQRDQYVARDRLTVDKDAPELRRTRALWAQVMGEEEEDEDEDAGHSAGHHAPDPEDLDLEAIGEAIASAGDEAPLDRARYFRRPDRSRVGDPSLTDPAQIRQALRSPIAYAKHVMVLGEAFARATGAHRSEVVQYMATMYAAMPDRAFARQALKEFGPATGVLDVYPLEIVEELVLRYPGSLPKVGFGRLFVRPQADSAKALELVEGRSSALSYPKNLKIRGFAIKGGGNPGYLFEPDEHPGAYRLRIDLPGRYRLMISAITRSGHTIVDTLNANVRPSGRRPRGGAPASKPAAMPRDASKVRSWPMPSVPSFDPAEALAQATAESQDNLLSKGELVSRREQGAMRGPSGDTHEDYGWGEAFEAEAPATQVQPRPPLAPAPVPEVALEDEDTPPPERLSQAEQAVLRIALATQLSSDDLIAVPADPAEPAAASSQAQAPRAAPDQPTAHSSPESKAQAEAELEQRAEATGPDPAPASGAPSPATAPAAPEAQTLAETPALRPEAATPFSAPRVSSVPPEPEPRPTIDSLVEPAPRVSSVPPEPEPRPTIEAQGEPAPRQASVPPAPQPQSRPTIESPVEPPTTPEPEPAPQPAFVASATEITEAALAAAPAAPQQPPPEAKPELPTAAQSATPISTEMQPLVRPPVSPRRQPAAGTASASPAPSPPIQHTEVVRVRAHQPRTSRPDSQPIVLTPAPSQPEIAQAHLHNVPIRSPMDDREPTEALERSGGFLADGRPLPAEAQGETDSEVRAYQPPPSPEPPPSPGGQRHVHTEVVRVRKTGPKPGVPAETVRIVVDDLVLDESE